MATVEILRDDGRNESDVPEPIPAFDYRVGLKAQYREIMAAIQRVLKSGTLILGPEVSGFESEFARFVGSQYAVGTSSGTDALIVALCALGVGPGDEVITVANGPVPTIAAIGAVGARARFAGYRSPHFADGSGPTSLGIERQNAVRRCDSSLWLASPDVEIQDFCQRHGLALIEDCAQAHGTKIGDTHAGGFGEIGCFSFYPTKNLGAFGDAGMCITNDGATGGTSPRAGVLWISPGSDCPCRGAELPVGRVARRVPQGSLAASSRGHRTPPRDRPAGIITLSRKRDWDCHPRLKIQGSPGISLS